MDEEDTRSYKQPCPQCSEVQWAISDEGRYYCKNCHTIIEKMKEVEESNVFIPNAKIKSINRGLRKPKQDWGWEWYICEGFQFVLLKQAEALEALGISPGIKDNVMCNLWRLFLRTTKQAYCNNPISQMPQWHSAYQSSAASSDLGTESDLRNDVSTESDGELLSQSNLSLPSSGQSELSGAETASSVTSGSIDGHIQIKKKPWQAKLSMPLTLAFCYLSLLWVRASVTLSDLLRLVFYHHIPYYNPQEYFPDKTRLYGADIHIFEVQNFPVYSRILELTNDLGKLLELPQFPPITETCYYHPNMLCMKYLMEVNLPDELHHWTCFVTKKAMLDDVTVLTYDPGSRKKMIPYDVQAVAIIIVALKLIFTLDDDLEWQLAKHAQKENQGENDINIFDFQEWYMTMRPCMDEARRKLEEEEARFPWSSERIMPYSLKARSRLMKRKRIAENLQRQFSKLAGAAPDAGNPGPSSFVFNWEEQNTGKICFHAHSLEGITQKVKKPLSRLKKNYWLNSVKKCRSRFCEHWKQYDESQFPSSYRFVLSLFSTVLRVKPNVIHYQVSLVEEKLLRQIPSRRPVKRLSKRMQFHADLVY